MESSVESTYNRCIRAHKLVFEAMERLRFEAFLDTQSTEQKGEIIGLAKEIHGNLKQEGIESHSANSILNEMAKR